jgi:hypothetical protein
VEGFLHSCCLVSALNKGDWLALGPGRFARKKIPLSFEGAAG